MKKVFVVLCLAVLTISMSGTALAADALYRMLHADEVESFKKDQDAIIVGQLTDKTNGKFKVDVLKVVSGKVKSDSILVSDDFHYGWGEAEPAVNDYCVMSLKRSGIFYKRAWGIYKADSGDYKTLKLVPVNSKSPGLSADLACIEWYVNSGGTENDFSFNSSNAFVRRPSGEVIQIYPKETSNESSIAPTKEEITSTQEEIVSTKTDPDNLKTGFGLSHIVIGVAAIALIVGLLLFIGTRKNTTN